MTKEEILKEFLADPNFQKKGLSIAKLAQMKFSEQSGDKLIEVIKLAIGSMKDGESEAITARKLNTFLSK